MILDAVLAEYEPGLRKLAKAQEQRQCLFETDIGFGLPSYDHLAPANQVARVLEVLTSRDLQLGKFDRAIDTMEMALRLSRDLRLRGGVIGTGVSLTIEGKFCYSIRGEILTAPGLRREHCDRLLDVLAQHRAAVCGSRDRASDSRPRIRRPCRGRSLPGAGAEMEAEVRATASARA